MKVKLAVMLLCMIILSAPDGQSSPAKGESKSEDWTVVEKLLETKCKLCHSLDRAKKAKKTREEWQSTIMRMKSYAPVLTDKEAKLIIDYLTHHYGKQ